MAAVTFCDLLLHDAVNTSDRMAFPTVSGLVVGIEARGEVRQYANGLTRLVTKAGRPRRARAVLPLLTKPQVWWLEEHAGRLLMVRSGQGHLLYATFFSADFDQLGFIPEANTEVQFAEVTSFDPVAL